MSNPDLANIKIKNTGQSFATGPETRLDVFPAFHQVANRKVLVLGGGEEAFAKVRLLSETNARILVISPKFEQDLRTFTPSCSNITVLNRSLESEDLEDAVLAFIATGELETDRKLALKTKSRGIPTNVVDRPELCNFYTPALVNRAPVAVAISTSGVAPVLARSIRARIESMLSIKTGLLAKLAAEFRNTVIRVFESVDEKRRFWSEFLNGSVSSNVYAGNLANARSVAQRLLNSSTQRNGFVWLVGAGPGAADLLTIRAHRVLQEADVILYDQLVPDTVVAMGRRDAKRIQVGKQKGHKSVSQDSINGMLVKLAKSGNLVVRLKSGDPMIFGRAGEEIDALRNANVSYEIIPGVTTALSAAASAEIPLTLRGIASDLVFVTGQDMEGETLTSWSDLALKGTTVAVYMGKSVAAKVSNQLINSGLDKDTPVVAIENASRSNEKIFKGSILDLEEFAHRTDVVGPVLFVIGKVVGFASTETAKPLKQSHKANFFEQNGSEYSKIAA